MEKKYFFASEDLLAGASIGLDMDGTLVEGLKSDKESSYGCFVELLKYLYSKKVKEVFLCTGRPTWAARDWVDSCFENSDEEEIYNKFLNTQHVLFDGAVVADLGSNMTYSMDIDNSVKGFVYREWLGEVFSFGFDTPFGYYVSDGYDSEYFPSESYLSLDELDEKRVHTAYLINFESKEAVLKVLDRISTLDKSFNKRRTVSGHYFYSFQGTHCAVLNPFEVNKMYGMWRKFAGNGGFERLIFIGDGSNDEPVFEEAVFNENVVAIPSPHTRDKSRLLDISKWERPNGNSVLDILKCIDVE